MNIEKFLGSFFNGTKNPSLEAVRFFMNEFGNVQNKLKFIHIAGTNGKGSTTEMISNVLIKCGYKVGKFMSPHLIKYNERTSINNVNISDEDLKKLILKIKPKIEEYNNSHKTKVTLFEVETTIALLYFFENNVDIAVLEVGLGGMYDCTNIIENPLVSIINTVDYDHMNILGNSLEEIAKEKIGIIKKDSNTVYVKQNNIVDDLVKEKCNKENNKLHLIDLNDVNNYSYNLDFQAFNYKNYNYVKVNLKGPKQIKNAVLCLECCDILKSFGFELKDEKIKKGLKTIIHKARFETIKENPSIIFDGAHNKSAVENLNETINMYYKDDKKTFIISLLKTKDYETFLEEILKQENSEFIFTSGNDKEKYVSKEELLRIAKEKTNKKILTLELEDAIKYAKENYEKISFFIGSFYVYKTVIDNI